MLARELESLRTYLAAQDEELDALWWLVGGRTLDGVPFSKVQAGAQPLVLSSDLAELTHLLPGPPSAAMLLARAVDSPDAASSVGECVNECSFEWIEHKLPGDPSPVAQPLHFALGRRLETRDTESWIPGWQAQTQLHSGATLPRLALAEMFYLEALQLKQ